MVVNGEGCDTERRRKVCPILLIYFKNERKGPVEKETLKPQETRKHTIESGAESLLSLRGKGRHLTMSRNIQKVDGRWGMNISNETQTFL